MDIRALEASAGLGWLKNGVNLGRNNPKAIFGGAAMMLGSIMVPVFVIVIVAATAGAAGVGPVGLYVIMITLMLAMMLLLIALMVGFLRLIDNVENGRAARARDVFSGIRDRGAMLRALGFMIVLMLAQNLLLVLLISLLAPDFGSWYLQTLQGSMHGVAQPPPTELPAGFALGTSMAWVLALFSYAVQAVGLGQIALRDRGVFGALADGVIGAAKNLLPLLVMLLVLIAVGIVAVIVLFLVVMVVVLLAKFVGAWLAVVIAVPLYIALLLVLYVVSFGVMYAMWRGIMGDTDASVADAQVARPGLEA